jgi:hypothetical protein
VTDSAQQLKVVPIKGNVQIINVLRCYWYFVVHLELAGYWSNVGVDIFIAALFTNVTFAFCISGSSISPFSAITKFL